MNQNFNHQTGNQFQNATESSLRNNAKLSKAYSWPIIILALIVFWPVGIFLMYKRFSADKTATLKNSKTVAIISYILMGMGIIYFIMAFSEDSSMLAAALLFGGGGIYLLFVSKRMKKDGERYKLYINLIVNQNQHSIDNIAAAAGVTYDTAKSDLQKMIQIGYFANGYIHEANREIIIQQHLQSQPDSVNAQQMQTKVAVCKSCGANNIVAVGAVSECEYCGSPIS